MYPINHITGIANTDQNDINEQETQEKVEHHPLKTRWKKLVALAV